MEKKGTHILYRVLCGMLLLVIFFNVLFLISTSGLQAGQLPRFFGYTPLIENTGSMEPVMERGDLLFVKEVKDLQEQDIIAWYNPEGGITTHRIVEVRKDGTYTTKGDSNNIEDLAAVKQEQIIGVYTGKLAKAGYLLMYLQKPEGFFTIVLLILIAGVSSLWMIEHKENKKLKER